MITRRRFLKLLAGVWAMLSFGFPADIEAKKLALSLDKVKKLKEVGGWALLKIKKKEFLFIRDTVDTVKVMNPICTHRQCTVEYNPEEGNIECPCHHSRYNLEGEVLNGPAERPLQRFESELKDGRIIFEIEG